MTGVQTCALPIYTLSLHDALPISGEGLSDNAKALLLSLLAGETEDRDAALKALREEWGVADRSTDTETAAAERGA